MRTGRPSSIKWTAEHDQMIQEQYKILGPSRLAERLRVPVNLLKNRAYRLGVQPKVFQWTSEAEGKVRERYPLEGTKYLSAELGITPMAVTAKARSMGVDSTRKTPPKDFEWSEEMLEAIRSRYVDEGAYKLAGEFGVTLDTVRRKASDLGLHTIAGHAIAGRIRAEESESCDIHYFDKWLPSMAWCLGFIFADGCINKDESGLSINIQRRDESIIEFIRKELKSVHKIRRNPGRVNTKTGNTEQDQSGISICSSILVEGLIRRGVNPRKTYNDDPFPAVPDDMLPHFLRGYFDGDGSVSTYTYKGVGDACCVGFVGSPRFVQGILDSLIRLAGMSHKVIQHQGKAVKWSEVSWTAQRDLKAFYSFIYPEGFSFCLERKRTKLAEWLARPHRDIFHQPWSEEELQLLRDKYSILGPTELAEMLGRSIGGVAVRAQGMGLKCKTGPKSKKV